jgi:hypothetical protein
MTQKLKFALFAVTMYAIALLFHGLFKAGAQLHKLFETLKGRAEKCHE